MDIEEKAKAYDEAIKVRRDILKDTTALKRMLPEFAESEDERIRKALIEFFGAREGVFPYIKEFTFNDIYTWLEKQKLQKPDKCAGCNNVKGCVTCVDGDQWAHIEQNPAEWSVYSGISWTS